MDHDDEMLLNEAGQSLSLSRERVLRLVTTGRLKGRRDASGWWRVSRSSIQRLKQEWEAVRRVGNVT